MKAIHLLLITGIILSACQKSSVDKKEEGMIYLTQTVAINEVPRATLTFSEVSDSRCPEGGQCIWAGNAEIGLTLEGVSTEGRITKNVKMCIGHCSNFKQDTLNEEFAGFKYRFILKAVSPYPNQDQPTKKSDYRISLAIDKQL